MLENGSDLEFDRRGQWTEIDAERATVPQSIIPLRIADYLKRNYPDRPVVKIDRDRRGTASSFRTEPISNSTFGAIFCASTIDAFSSAADSLPRMPGVGPFTNFSYLCRERPKADRRKRSAGRKTTR
ncbi:MAG: PepSY-like domain-containing protein [Alistipes sp.]